MRLPNSRKPSKLQKRNNFSFKMCLYNLRVFTLLFALWKTMKNSPKDSNWNLNRKSNLVELNLMLLWWNKLRSKLIKIFLTMRRLIMLIKITHTHLKISAKFASLKINLKFQDTFCVHLVYALDHVQQFISSVCECGVRQKLRNLNKDLLFIITFRNSIVKFVKSIFPDS